MTQFCSVIIPFSSDELWRLDAFQHVGMWWDSIFPEYEVIIGHADPWSKGKAVQEAVAESSANILIIADADSFLYEAHHIRRYIELIQFGSAKWIVPHAKVYRLSEQGTLDYYKTGNLDLSKTHYPPYMSCLGGGMVILSHAAWEESGGLDPRFLGWGGEDRSWGRALETLVGPCYKGSSQLVHLWHPNQGPRQPVSRQTIKLIERYQKAYRRPVLMKQLRQEIRDTMVETEGGRHDVSIDGTLLTGNNS